MAWQLPVGRRRQSESGYSKTKRKRTRQAVVLVGVGTLVVCGLGVGAWQMFKPSTDDGDGGSLQALASNALEAATEMSTVLRENVTRDASRLADLFGAGNENDEDVEEDDVMAEPEVVEAAPTRRRVARRASPPPADAVPMVKTGPSVIATMPELPPLPGLFDSATPGIIPPGTDNIRLHTLEAEEVPAAERGLVEVIVSPYGEVERAKLISTPGDVHEAMILSAIKAWQFTPALKDGHPVRYRLILPVDVALSGKVLVTHPSDTPKHTATAPPIAPW